MGVLPVGFVKKLQSSIDLLKGFKFKPVPELSGKYEVVFFYGSLLKGLLGAE